MAVIRGTERLVKTGQERRRGTNEANPNAGQLSGQLAAKNTSRSPEPQQPDRLVVSTRFLLSCRLDYG